MKDEILDHVTRQFRTLEDVFERANDKAWALQDQRLVNIPVISLKILYLEGKKDLVINLSMSDILIVTMILIHSSI